MSRHLLLLLVLSLLLGPSATGQRSSPSEDRPARLLDIVAPSTLETGTVGHFRAQVAPESQRPVNYLWDLGDGTLSVGMLVSHAYASPGTYTLTVTARNAQGRDTLQTQVTVAVPAEPTAPRQPSEALDPPPSVSPEGPDDGEAEADSPPRAPFSRTALFGGGGVTDDAGGFTWVLHTDLWEERAQDAMLYHRLRGLRADMVVDTTGRGSPAYRVVAGQFDTPEEALAARVWLPDGPEGTWLLHLERPERDAAAPQ